MGHRSHPEFVTLHALRIKGFAPVHALSEMSAAHDADVRAHLAALLHALHGRAAPIVGSLRELLDRLAPYGSRLDQVVRRVSAGETNMFTGVMCSSDHDVWMELHEDVILSQGIDRAAEGST